MTSSSSTTISQVQNHKQNKLRNHPRLRGSAIMRLPDVGEAQSEDSCNTTSNFRANVV
ncbi:hypothetical protein NECAME_17967 [Necator americanus]|uniref:Uncharacterized protein n=1 Tax=Necator americanus TaxID=51031 RepID=W2TH39_NECAM|nr:hypothetical protein NECAME_17967 [Necator americanus]ETN80909.1 hypothetical protein NECAME_17967 [Necator americanus]